MTRKSQFQLQFSLLAIFLAISFQSCLKDDCNSIRTFIQYSPVYKTVDEIRTDIKVEGPKELQYPGKLYYYKDYIIINELKEGLHIIDNTNPASPNHVSFVAIPGNVDMAVKNGRLYADNYIDLLTINIEDPANPRLVNRTENVFNRYSLDQDLGYLVDYEAEEISVEINCSDPGFGNDWFWRGGNIFVDVAFDANTSGIGQAESNSSGAVNNAFGIGGSMARFTIAGQYMYTVDEFSLQIFDLIDCDKPVHRNTVQVGWGIETIFPTKDKLFLGANNGVHIFDYSDPVNPRRESMFEHARACDPVYVVGDIAYVTLRDGSACEGFDNQLDVLDVSNINNPTLLASYPMENPHGLSVTDHKLYLCEGEFGLKVFDVEDVMAIDKNRLEEVKGFTAFDVITLLEKDIALLIGQNGLYQFDISDPTNLQEISVLPVNRK